MAEARKPKSSAQALLATAPHTLNGTAWLEQHEALAHHMLHMMARALVKPAGRATDAMLQSVAQAHAALRIHAKQVLGGAVPVVLATDGRQTIPFEELTEARAKVAVLEDELQAERTAHTQVQELLAQATACVAQGAALPADLVARMQEALDQARATPDDLGKAEGTTSVQHLVRNLAGQEFTAGRQAMHADILAMLTRRLGEFTAASKRYPQTAGQLSQAAGVLKVARKQIQELQP